MKLCIDAKQLRAALKDIEAAETNGFMHCLAVLRVVSAGRVLDQNTVEYSDMIEKAHPTNPSLDWGRFQSVTRRYTFKRGKLVPIKEKKVQQ